MSVGERYVWKAPVRGVWAAVFCLCILFGVCSCGKMEMDLSPASSAEAKPIRALLITGGCCHDYENQKRILTEGVSARANVVWTVVKGGDTGRDHKVSVYEKAGWATGFDVIVHNECFGGVEDVAFVEGIAQAHYGGTGAVMIHCALHSYRGITSDAWRECLGVSSFNHGKKSAIIVSNAEPSHPIMKGFGDEWVTPEGELYNIEKVWPKTEVLGEGLRKDGNQDVQACIWTTRYGKGRVFGTSLGHHNSTMEDPTYLNLVTRGLLWSVGKLDKND